MSYPLNVEKELAAAGPGATVKKAELDGTTYYRINEKDGRPFAQVAYDKGGHYNPMQSYRF